MSSITLRPNGRRWIQYHFAGKRHTLRLGRVSEAAALEVQRRLDGLVESRSLGIDPSPPVAAWLWEMPDALHAGLIQAGLASSRGPATVEGLLAEHLRSLIAKGRKASTVTNNRVVHANLVDFLGAKRPVRTIVSQDAGEFRAYLATKGGRGRTPLAPATVSSRCRKARGVFAFAVRQKWLADNPFAGLVGGREWNHDRDVYVPMGMFTRILDMTADKELRLLLALVRICGPRCPSEVTPLRWSAVKRDAGVIVIRSPKTEEHPDGDRRETPLFPALLPYLDEAWEAAGERCELMFPRHQTSGAAITGRLESLCRKAGEVLWPKPFVNMRASAVRDAMILHPNVYDVAPWFGHSPEIAIKHYHRVVKEQNCFAYSNGGCDAKQNAKHQSRSRRTSTDSTE